MVLDDLMPGLVNALREAIAEPVLRQLYGLPVLDVAPLLEAREPEKAAKALIVRTELRRIRDVEKPRYDVFNVRTGNSATGAGFTNSSYMERWSALSYASARANCNARNERARALGIKAFYAVREKAWDER